MTDFPCLTGIFPRITYTHYSSCFPLIPCKKGVSVFFVAALEILECGTKFSCKSSFKAEQTQQSQLFFIWQASKSLGYVCVGLSLDCPCLYRFSFFNSRAQHWREWNKCGLTSAVQRGIMTSSLSAGDAPVHAAQHPVSFFASTLHLDWACCPPESPSPFPQNCSPAG